MRSGGTRSSKTYPVNMSTVVLLIGSPMVIGGADYRWRAKPGMCFAEHCGASYIQRTPRVMYVLLTIIFNALIMMIRGTCIWLALDPQMGLGVLLFHCRQDESTGPNNHELVVMPIKGHPVDKNGWYFSKRFSRAGRIAVMHSQRSFYSPIHLTCLFLAIRGFSMPVDPNLRIALLRLSFVEPSNHWYIGISHQ